MNSRIALVNSMRSRMIVPVAIGRFSAKMHGMGESKNIGITLLGCGTVGGGVVNVLLKQREVIRRRTGVDLVLKHVVVKSEAEYPPNAKELPMSTDAAAAIDDPGTQIVVELIGGTGVSAT